MAIMWYCGNKCKIINPKNLILGNNIYIGDNFYCSCEGKVLIKTGTIISNNCTIISYNHNYKDNLFLPYGLENIYKDVIIDENVWIGINVNIAPGVVIKKNSIIGMGTTVTKAIPENVIYGGNKIVSERAKINKKYDLLSVRTIYNPLNYIKILFIFKQIKNKFNKSNDENLQIIKFEDIKNKYRKDDYLSLIYILCKNKKYDINWEDSCIKI